ncbi:MAG TPA: DUF4271 domain-containing protein [Chitinophagaceae bacterium]|nr:DUF4271 domain-containing protein [Chitinophagaceae bacterium]
MRRAPRVAPVQRDTTVRADTVVRTDTVQPVLVPAVPERDVAGTIRSVLKDHPYFNFFGKPIVQVAEKRQEDDQDVMFYVLLGLFFYFALVKLLFSKYINNLFSIFLRISLRQQQLREQLLQSPFPSLMMNMFFLVTGGLYASLLLSYYKYEVNPDFWIQTLYCIAILALIYAGKFFILKFTGWVFGLTRATDTYIFIVFLVNKMLGILLLPFLVLIAFYTGQAQQVFVTLSLMLVVFLFAYRFIFSFRPVRAEIKVNPFHFFIYLCAFEIAPLLLIYKVLLSILKTSN